MNEQDIALLASKRLKGAPVLPLMSFVQNALNNLSRQVSADTERRKLLVTDQTTTTATITTSTPYCYADTTTLQTTPGIALDWIRQGTVFFNPSVTVSPYILSGGTYASGYWTFVSNPQQGETIAVNGVTFTFKYPALTIEGAGTANVDGEYTSRGTFNSKPYWNLVGSPDQYDVSSVVNGVHAGGFWEILYDDSALLYIQNRDGDGSPLPYPDVDWTTGGDTDAEGAEPVPTVNKSTTTLLTAVQVEIGATVADTAANFAAALNASVNASITVATYEVDSSTDRYIKVIGTYDTQGTGGNAFTLANSSLASVTRSGATFSGGAATAYALSIDSYTTDFEDLSRVQFTTTVSLPTGISASTNYYLTDYTIDGNIATFNLSSTADGLTPVTISTAGSGVLTMSGAAKQVCQWLNSPNQGFLTPAIPVDYIYIWLEKDLLYTSTTAGTFSFAVPFIPKNVESLPAQLTNDLVDEVIQIAISAGFEPLTEAEK